ncbi:hypothetical protein OVA21_09500 [Dietzia sp. SL131]|uniref:hypothetical protein n=1 Tax=unclassified Dietzia TaxID=2617939 RepID=UPI0021AE06D5|nr:MULTISPECIES: hypothetical protein [unclassified Dietzia]MCY1657432.1 hypothetical protein [Dietzia sp. SL131]UVE95978.1 hypothetical protein L8M95_04090 [Dietzia sp. B32]
MTPPLKVPCTYQGGKQRVAAQIADILLNAAPHANSQFFDLCCGSGAISVELVNRGVAPERITMLDSSSWGAFWAAVGTSTFRIEVFEKHLARIPEEKCRVKAHMAELSRQHPAEFEAEIYPILQSCSFGGKQLWWDGVAWKNAFFRDYWQPTATSVRRSPANPMQPRPEELYRRVREITLRMAGVTGLRTDIASILDGEVPADAVVYIDPPYSGTTNYGFDFDILGFTQAFRARTDAALFVSEGRALSEVAVELRFGGANGGISGNRASKHREWLTRF